MPEGLRVALLSIILAAYLAFGAAYAVKTPTWETPDEPAHFNYIRHLAERLEFPILQPGDYDQAYLEKLKAAKFPPTMSIEAVRYESWQPPLYYVLATPLYWASSALSQPQQVVVLRLFSVLLGAGLLVVAYGIARSIFPKDDLIALAVPGFIAVLPQHLATSASVSNDTLAELILSVILLVLVRGSSVSTDGATDKRMEIHRPIRLFAVYSLTPGLLLLGFLLGLAVLAKTSVFVAAVLIPLGLLLHEYGANKGRIRLGLVASQAAIVFAVALVVSGWWFVRNAFVYGGLDFIGWSRHALVVQGQPLVDGINIAYVKLIATWTFKSFWAQFGWMGVLADERTYILLGVLTAIAGAGLVLFVVQLARQPRSLTRYQWSGLLLLVSALFLVAGVMVVYNLRYIQPQGRYLFPAIVPIALCFALGLREVVDRRYAALFFAALYLALLALDYICLTGFILPQLTS